jgi:hypothetical protein
MKCLDDGGRFRKQFFLSPLSRVFVMALEPTQWVPDTLSSGVKRPESYGNHLPPSSNEVSNAWTFTSTPPYVFMAWHRDTESADKLKCKKLLQYDEEIVVQLWQEMEWISVPNGRIVTIIRPTPLT